MTTSQARNAATTVGYVSACLGAALSVAPGRAGPLLGLPRRQGARTVGWLDLLLVPGLPAADDKRPWLTARLGLNLGIAAYALRLSIDSGSASSRSRVFALTLLIASVRDAAVLAALHRG